VIGFACNANPVMMSHERIWVVFLIAVCVFNVVFSTEEEKQPDDAQPKPQSSEEEDVTALSCMYCKTSVQ